MVAPIIDELAEEMKEVRFVKINVDENQDLAAQYSVFSIPTFLIFKDGVVKNQFVGAQSKEGFKDQIKKV
jgi:thioredoxin 1